MPLLIPANCVICLIIAFMQVTASPEHGYLSGSGDGNKTLTFTDILMSPVFDDDNHEDDTLKSAGIYGYSNYHTNASDNSSVYYGTALSWSWNKPEEDFVTVLKKRSVKRAMMSAEHRLYKYLFAKGRYRKTVRPKMNHTERLYVSLGICIMSVDEILENQDPMVTSGCVKLKWIDEYLVWDPARFGNLTSFVLPSSDIWLPDIALINSAEPYITNRSSYVEVSYKGAVGFYPSGRFSTKCKISLTFFPFDRQVCEMQFESWTYPVEWIELTLWPLEPIDVKEFYRNHQWDLDRVDAVSGKAFYDGFEFSTMRFVFHVRRRTLHYITLYIFPCSLISIMQVLSHSLPVEHPARITLLTGIFVAQSVIQSSLASQTPKSSDGISLTQLYIEIFTACMLFSMIVTFINMHVWFRVSTSRLLRETSFPTLGVLLKSFLFWDVQSSSPEHYHYNYQHVLPNPDGTQSQQPQSHTSHWLATHHQHHHHESVTAESGSSGEQKVRQHKKTLRVSQSLRQFCKDLKQNMRREATEMTQRPSQQEIFLSPTTLTVKKEVQFEHQQKHSKTRQHLPRRYSTLAPISMTLATTTAAKDSLSFLRPVPASWNQTMSPDSTSTASTMSPPSSTAASSTPSSLVVQKEAWLRFCLTLDKVCMYIFLIANVLTPIVMFAIVPHTYNQLLQTFDEDAHNSTNYFYTVSDIRVHYFHDFTA